MQTEGLKVRGKPADGAIFIGVDYEEFAPETYRGVRVQRREGKGSGEEIIFNSGDFEKDLEAATGKAKAWADLHNVSVFVLSSVDNYKSDCKA